MITADAAAAAAITSPERAIKATVSVDWDSDGHSGVLDDLTPLIGTVKIDRQLSSDLPAQVRLVEGSAVAEANVDLVHTALHLPGGDLTVREVLSAHNDAALGTAAGFATTYTLARAGDYVIIALTVNDSTTLITPDLRYDVLSDVSDGAGLRTVIYGRYIETLVDEVSFDIGYWYLGGTMAWTIGAIVLGPTYRGTPFLGASPVGSGTNETGTGTTHTTPTITGAAPRSVYVSVFANTTTSGTWAPPSGDTEQLDTRGTHATTNVALEINTSPVTGPGGVSKTATSSASISTATMTLIRLDLAAAGDETTLPGWLLNPLNTASPLAGKTRLERPVRIDASIITATGRQTIRRFTGQTRAVALTSGRTAEISALDLRERMRALLVLPPIVGAEMGLNASALVSLAFTVAGFRPAPVPELIVSVDPPGRWVGISSLPWLPLHGSLAPALPISWFEDGGPSDITTYTNVGGGEVAVRPSFVAGPFVSGAYAGVTSATQYTVVRGTMFGYTLVPSDGVLPDHAVTYVEFWFRNDTIAAPTFPTLDLVTVYQPDFAVAITLTAGILQVGATRKPFVRLKDGATQVFETTGSTVTIDGGWHSIGIRMDLRSTTKTVVFSIDGGAEDSHTVSVGAHDLSVGTDSATTVTSYLPISDLHVQVSPTSALKTWRYADLAQDVFIDPSRLELEGILDRDRYEAWELVAALAQAEQAEVLFDENGVGRYRTRARMLEAQMADVQVTLSTVDSITDIAAETAVDAVRNIVTMPYADVSIHLDYAYALPAALLLPPLSVTSVRVAFDAILASFDSDFDYLTAEPATPATFAICNTAADGSGSDVTTSLIFLASLDVDGTGSFLYINNNSFDVWVLNARVAGRVVEDLGAIPVTASDDASMTKYGQQPLDLTSSPWVQSEAIATELVTQVLGDTREPTVVLSNLAIVADPRLQIDDRVALVDHNGTALSGQWWITGVEETIGGGEYSMAIAARQALPVAVWDSAYYWDESMWGV